MTLHPQPSQALTFTANYDPGASFRVIARRPQNVVYRILCRQADGESIIDDTTDYDAYLASYRSQGDSPGEYFLLFVDGSLQDDQQYTFDIGVAFFATRLDVIEVGIDAGEGSRFATSTRSSSPVETEGLGGRDTVRTGDRADIVAQGVVRIRIGWVHRPPVGYADLDWCSAGRSSSWWTERARGGS